MRFPHLAISFCPGNMESRNIPSTPKAPRKIWVARSRVNLTKVFDKMSLGDEHGTPVKMWPQGFWTAKTNLEKEALMFEPLATSTLKKRKRAPSKEAKRRKGDLSPGDIFA